MKSPTCAFDFPFSSGSLTTNRVEPAPGSVLTPLLLSPSPPWCVHRWRSSNPSSSSSSSSSCWADINACISVLRVVDACESRSALVLVLMEFEHDGEWHSSWEEVPAAAVESEAGSLPGWKCRHVCGRRRTLTSVSTVAWSSVVELGSWSSTGWVMLPLSGSWCTLSWLPNTCQATPQNVTFSVILLIYNNITRLLWAQEESDFNTAIQMTPFVKHSHRVKIIIFVHIKNFTAYLN